MPRARSILPPDFQVRFRLVQEVLLNRLRRLISGFSLKIFLLLLLSRLPVPILHCRLFQLGDLKPELVFVALLDFRLLLKIFLVMSAALVGSEPLTKIATATITETVGVVGRRGVGDAQCCSDVGVA